MQVSHGLEDDNGGYPVHIFPKLQMLWTSKPSVEELAESTAGLAINAPPEEKTVPHIRSN